ncbi:hypothetical protein [Aeromicrobium sp. HA]|uniref:hypothetical protein n=1 Tax=Aeromicrobium sp. HA TaxID=3009077 RepID=UPI0022AFB668|nr:hypothetical protein [Aeromicrobium sp. HA]
MHLPHPWRTLRSLPEVTLVWHDGGAKGHFNHDTLTLSLRRGMTQAERRSVVQHELEHHARGRVWAAWREREEAACEIAAARELIDLQKLGETLAWAHCAEEAADELWVDVDLLKTRLETLHPAERAYLRQRLAHLH